MLNLQTKVAIPEPGFTIDYSNTVSLFGSCFSGNIGSLLNRHKFNTSLNPFGVLYNPESIAQGINLLFEKQEFTDEDLSFFNEQWFSFYHHSSFSAINKADCLSGINNSFLRTKLSIVKSNIVIITLGTAWVYRHKTTNMAVANCHKLPAKEFNRKFLEPEQIAIHLSKAIKKIIDANPSVKIIFTISPIRHLKDGAIENMRSKSALTLAVKKIQELFAQTYYFPSFEIFIDELRDYRFYASDMLHPSELSINYIWEIFKRTFFSKETFQINKEIEKLVKSFEHRPFNTNTEQYAKFKINLIKSADKIEQNYPLISFTNERNKLM